MKEEYKQWQYKRIDSKDSVHTWTHNVSLYDCKRACKAAGDKWAIFDPNNGTCVYDPRGSAHQAPSRNMMLLLCDR